MRLVVDVEDAGVDRKWRPDVTSGRRHLQRILGLRQTAGRLFQAHIQVGRGEFNVMIIIS